MDPHEGHGDDVPTVPGAASDSAAPFASRPPVLVPLSEGRYTVLGMLGRGGQSIVHRAHDAAIGREVAIKEVLPGNDIGTYANEAVARFLREARITGQLEHPGIVPVHELGVKPDGSPYCVQKLVRGRTLAVALAGCRGAEERLALLPHLVAACHAVAFAHGRGVIHRDLKPANIMVGEFGETVVLDWGIARVLGEPTDEAPSLSPDLEYAGLTVVGSGLGTPGYSSPEQSAGHHERVDRRSDVWSLGAILEKLIAVPPDEEAREAPPPELVAIARRALSLDPDMRYASAAVMAADLEAFRDGGLVSAHEYGSWEMLRRLVAQHRTVAAAVAVGLVALVIALVLISRAWAESRANLAEAFTQQANRAAADLDWPVAEASHAMAASLRDRPSSRWGAAIAAAGDPVAGLAWHAHDGDVSKLSISHDGELVLTVDHADAAIWMLDSGANACRLEGPGVFVSAAVFDAEGIAWTIDDQGLAVGWSPSSCREVARHATGIVGIRHAWAEAPGRLLLSVNGGRVMRLDTRLGSVEPLGPAARGVDWEVPSPRGDRVVSMCAGGTIALRRASEPPGERLPHGHLNGILDAVVSLDGNLFATCGDDRTVLLRTWPDGAERARLTGHAGPVGVVAFTPDGTLLATSSNDAVMLWSTRHGRLHARFSAGFDVGRLAFTPDGRTLVTVGQRGVVRTWRIPDWSRHVAAGDPIEIRALGFAAGGSLLLVGGADGDLRVIRVSDGLVVARADAHDEPYGVNGVSVHPSGELVATAGNEGTVATWTLPGLELLGRIAPGEREAFCVAWSPDGESLWSGWGSGAVLRHDRALRGPPARLQAHERHGAISLNASADGRILVTSSRDSTARVWDVSTLTLRRELKTEGSALAAALSPDGRVVATATDAEQLTAWEWETGEKLAELRGHEHWIMDVAFRPDGEVLASVGFDAVRLWDLRSRHQLVSMEVRDLGALRVAWSPDGSWLATSTLHGIVHYQPVGDPSLPVDVDAVLARRRLHRDGMTFTGRVP